MIVIFCFRKNHIEYCHGNRISFLCTSHLYFQATTMPRAVRFLAFRLLGRVLCVSRRSSSSKSQTSERRRSCERGDQVQSSGVDESLLHGETQTSDVVKTSSNLVDKINDVLVELRKVRLYMDFAFNRFFMKLFRTKICKR